MILYIKIYTYRRKFIAEITALKEAVK